MTCKPPLSSSFPRPKVWRKNYRTSPPCWNAPNSVFSPPPGVRNFPPPTAASNSKNASPCLNSPSNKPNNQHSITPLLHHSNTPPPQYKTPPGVLPCPRTPPVGSTKKPKRPRL